MAQEEVPRSAESGTEGQSSTPKWDSFEGEMYPFLSVKEDEKRKGFKVKFLSDKPRKETPNKFNGQETDFWFDVEYEGDTYTWTISQISIVMELQKYKPLSGKEFDIKLVPVDDDFKKQFPKYKGKDRYTVTEVGGEPTVDVEDVADEPDK